MSLPTGTWKIVANGLQGELNINSVDGEGNLDANMVIQGTPESQLIGLWDDSAQKIAFFRVLDPASPVTQVYTGFLFDNSRDQPTNLTYTLTGFFEALQSVPAHRTLYGWFAQITIPG